MARLSCGILLSVLAAVSLAKPVDEKTNVEFRMPHVQPKVPDTYLCFPMKLDSTKPTYLTGFVPHANMTFAHHILLYGCEQPGQAPGTDKGDVWNCGEMLNKSPNYEMGPVCKEAPKIVYAWAMDAPALTLPPDVGFKVGGDTTVQWLVLQVHYKDVSPFIAPKNEKDNSGITMVMTPKPQPRRAGVYLMMTDGEIGPHSTTYMEVACSYNDKITIHPFAFRTHAHVHGEVNTGYVVHPDGEWEEIGRMSPKKPEMFYNVTHPGMLVKKGDTLAARCTMVNNENRTVKIGATQNDEMCNFYVMYWAEGDQAMKEDYCMSPGPPAWNFENMDGLNMDGIPKTASIVPGTEKLLEESETVKKIIDDGEMDVEAKLYDLMQDMLEQEDQPRDEPEYYEANEQGETDMDPELLREVMDARQQGYYPVWDEELEDEERPYRTY